MTVQPVATFTNSETRMQSRVQYVPSRVRLAYSVSLTDLDSGETLPTFYFFHYEEQAVEKARELVDVDVFEDDCAADTSELDHEGSQP